MMDLSNTTWQGRLLPQFARRIYACAIAGAILAATPQTASSCMIEDAFFEETIGYAETIIRARIVSEEIIRIDKTQVAKLTLKTEQTYLGTDRAVWTVVFWPGHTQFSLRSAEDEDGIEVIVGLHRGWYFAGVDVASLRRDTFKETAWATFDIVETLVKYMIDKATGTNASDLPWVVTRGCTQPFIGPPAKFEAMLRKRGLME